MQPTVSNELEQVDYGKFSELSSRSVRIDW